MRKRTQRDASSAEKSARQKTIHARESREKSSFRAPSDYREAYEAWLVAADAYLEEGNQEKARYAKSRANKIRSYYPNVSPPRYTTKQTQRIYKHLRRRGRKPKQALEHAKNIRVERIVGVIGDRNPIDHDGGFVFRTTDGFNLEYIQSVNESGSRKRIYIVELDRTEEIPDWINPGFYQTMDISRGVFRKRWNNPSAIVRARARAEVASYYGWEELDSYPKELTRKEVIRRYAVQDRERVLQTRSRIRRQNNTFRHQDLYR